jgi:hypothetical protein
MQWTERRLDELPTLCEGQADDLKIDTRAGGAGGAMRVWLSRCGPEDGQTRPIDLELYDGRRWNEAPDGVYAIDADDPSDDGLWSQGDTVEIVTGTLHSGCDGYSVTFGRYG